MIHHVFSVAVSECGGLVERYKLCVGIVLYTKDARGKLYIPCGGQSVL